MKIKRLSAKYVFRPTHWVFGIGFFVSAVAVSATLAQTNLWSTQELKAIRSLWLNNLPKVPSDSSNKFENNPEAIALGKSLFMEKQLSGNDDVSCSSCHIPEKQFADNQDLSEGMGLAGRHTPHIVGSVYSTYQFWDGRADSLWMQALGPLENPMEHGTDRMQVVRIVKQLYAKPYEKLFGTTPDFSDAESFLTRASPLGDEIAQRNWANMSAANKNAVNRAFSNVGKAMAAYVRTLVPQPARLDDYTNALEKNPNETTFNADEIAGLKLFIGKANCIACHGGALLTDQQFHNTGIANKANATPDLGRFDGLKQLVSSEFNCRSVYSDAAPDQCLALSKAELDILESDTSATKTNKYVAAFKTPSLRNVATTNPYMHNGQFKTLKQVLEHYNKAPSSSMGTSELKPLGLSAQELNQLERFLNTLNDSDATIR